MKTPLRVSLENSPGISLVHIYDAEDQIIYSAHSKNESRAREIATACNSHDALVAENARLKKALADCVKMLDIVDRAR